VSSDFMGSSLYIPLEDANPHTFHVRVKDEWGNQSETIESITSQVSRPDDVTRFSATAQDEHIQFAWSAIEGLEISYEIRAGDSWDSGFAIGVASSDSATFLHPGDDISRFWIKARSAVGLYSDGARFIDTALPPPMNRHEYYHINLLEENWPGARDGFEPGIDDLLFLTGVQGSYTFDVEFPQAVRAQNQLKLGVKALSDSRQTWGESDFTWDDIEANSPWFPLANADGVHTQVEISVYDEALQEYKDPVPMVTGDYEYQKTKITIHMQAPITSEGRSCISQCRLDIRVPQRLIEDVIDVTKEGINIEFEKPFYTAPQVMTNIVGGTSDTLVNISHVTKTGFTIGLTERGPNLPISGQVHWSALGY